jgi:hypothetical protein
LEHIGATLFNVDDCNRVIVPDSQLAWLDVVGSWTPDGSRGLREEEVFKCPKRVRRDSTDSQVMIQVKVVEFPVAGENRPSHGTLL